MAGVEDRWRRERVSIDTPFKIQVMRRYLIIASAASPLMNNGAAVAAGAFAVAHPR